MPSVLTIHINLKTVSYTHVEHSSTKTIYIKYYLKDKSKVRGDFWHDFH